MAISPGTPAFDPPTGSAADTDYLIAEAHLRARRRRRRNGAMCAAALALAGVLYVLWDARTAPPSGGGLPPAASQSQEEGAVQQAFMGNPVRLDGMTFVVEKLAVATAADLANDRPLDTEDRHLWLLTVTVRNDRGIAQHDPFCHGVNHLGAAIVTMGSNYLSWWDGSRSLHGNGALCSDIQPFATERFHLLFSSRGKATIAGVLLDHRARGSQDFARAYVEIHTRAPFVRQQFVDDRDQG